MLRLPAQVLPSPGQHVVHGRVEMVFYTDKKRGELTVQASASICPASQADSMSSDVIDFHDVGMLVEVTM